MFKNTQNILQYLSFDNSNIKIIHYQNSEEVKQMMLNLLNSFPKFEPGKHKGVPVRVQFLFPIRINLK